MKKFISGFIAGALIFGMVGVFAATYVANTAEFKVFVNGTEFVSDPPVLEVDGRTYLPLRAMGDALGVPVNWNAELGQVEVGTTPQNSNSGVLLDGKYYVEILSARKSKDYEGNDVAIVTFNFTNNSEEGQFFLSAITAKAFQNNVQLETAFMSGDQSYNSSNSLKEIKPGGTIEVQKAYLLTDNSPLLIEASALFSMSDDVVSKTFTTLE